MHLEISPGQNIGKKEREGTSEIRFPEAQEPWEALPGLPGVRTCPLKLSA